MTVLIAERKGVPSSSIRPGRVEFTAALQTSTVVVLTLPLSPSTADMISTPELALMRPDAVLVNVSRGGIIDEEALVTALRSKQIAGVATDVYVEEPCGQE
jgi:phosphoglycerate dehydrogenase-like enzyme